MEVLSFAVSIPPDVLHPPRGPHQFDDPHKQQGVKARPPRPINALKSDEGVVGTITLFAKKSVMVWFGFGKLLEPTTAATTNEPSNALMKTVGTGTFRLNIVSL
jgi:hypothetical protein